MKNRFPLVLVFIFLQLNLFSQNIIPQKSDNWAKFEDNYGSTIFNWKEGMTTPHRVICQPIKLSNTIENKDQLESLLRGFIQKNRSVFQINDSQLKVSSIHKARHIWYANFVQTYEGMEVINSEITFRVHENGNLFVFGVDYFQEIELPDSNLKSREDLNAGLQNYYARKQAKNIRIKTEADLKIFPIKDQERLVFKIVRVSKVHNDSDVNEVVYTDAHTLEVVHITNKIHDLDIHGHVQCEILPELATDISELRILENMYLDFDGNQVLLDEFGNFNYSSPDTMITLTAQLKGPYLDVINFSGVDAVFTQTFEQDDSLNLIWDDSNSTLAERNTFYHINLMHKHNKAVDPGFTNLDSPLPCVVNDNSATCNAYFNGTNIHFNVEGPGCAINSAHSASVIYHEYGHAINDRIYKQAGALNGLGNQALHEAFADIYACTYLDESQFAQGFWGPGTISRDLNNVNTYPGSVIGQEHTDGLMLGGAFWDLRLLTSPELAYELAHFAKYGTPDDSDLGMAFSEVFIETLIADDDDGNLMNGTPNSAAIENAFCQHGIGSNLFAVHFLDYTPLPNTVDVVNDYRIEIGLPPSPFIAEALDQMSVVYSTNNFASTSTVLFSQIDEDSYEAFIPSQPEGTLIKYYFKIPNGNCGSFLTHPSRDFFNENYSFYVGNYITVFEDDFETNQGWQLSNASDNATFGLWQRNNPQQVIDNQNFVVQPDDDYSDDGERCLVTGAIHGAQWYSFDVDGGKTTVTSPVFENLNETSIVTFYKWFVHGAGFIYPAQGEWRMEVSNNGNTWTSVEIASYGDHRRWIKSSFKLSDILDVTNQMQVRFIASDFGAGSIVEALVDEFSIVNLASAVGVNTPLEAASVQVYPNPVDASIFIKFNTPASSEVELKLFSVRGILIGSGSERISSHHPVIQWKRDAAILDGIYFLQITSEDFSWTRKLVFE